MSEKVFYETADSIPVYDECDILVIGGGSAGHSAALAAARAGAKNIILMERYGYMGGDVTGGYVVMVPNLSWYNKSFVRGIQEEWFTRLNKIPGAVRGPSLDKIGSKDPLLLQSWGAIHDCVSRGGYGGSKEPNLVRAVYYEPNQLKIEMDIMLREHKDSIRVLYHCWGAKPIVEEGNMKGVIFESKEGRKAVMAKIVIDATGDGDIFSRAGAPFATLADGECRSSSSALVWRIAGMNWDAYYEWQQAHPESAKAVWGAMRNVAGFRTAPLPTNQNDMCWMNNWHDNHDCARIADQTATEMNTRVKIREILAYLQEAVPVAFRNSYLYDIAPQLGTRCSRRLVGEYVMSANDFAFATQFDDVIAWHSTICQINDCGPVEIPYRSIVAKGIDNLLCPGRHFSADNVSIDWLNLIPQCVGTGQAAGVAAAVAIKDKTGTRDVNIRTVQDILVDQDVPLPRNAMFEKKDPTYKECVETHNYGLYTDLAKKAHSESGELNKYRQC